MNNQIIGIIGLGMMGVPMANNLLKGNFTVKGYDLNPLAKEKINASSQFEWVNSPEQIAQSCNAIILMLPDSNIVDRLLWGDANNGIVSHFKGNTVVIDMSSSKPTNSKMNAEKLEKLGFGFIDAPVSGGVKRAIDGSLAIMIGGNEKEVSQAMPIFNALGKTIVHVGTAGSGHAVKALNNYVSAAGLLAVSEALVAAEKFGVDPHLVNKVFNASSGKNNTTEVKVENFMLSEKYNSGFAIALMRKDIQTAKDFIDDMQSPGEFANLCLDQWQSAEKTLDKGADHTAMFAFIKNHH
jgi:3-hydroxyisobutyrate dehydrogenase